MIRMVVCDLRIVDSLVAVLEIVSYETSAGRRAMVSWTLTAARYPF